MSKRDNINLNKNKRESIKNTMKLFWDNSIVAAPVIVICGIFNLIMIGFAFDSGPIIINSIDSKTMKAVSNFIILEIICLTPILLVYIITVIVKQLSSSTHNGKIFWFLYFLCVLILLLILALLFMFMLFRFN